jgi:L-rhamnose isomerase/sugar isomerase
VHRAYVQACLVDRAALGEHQSRNDAIMALATLKQAFTTDVTPILAKARLDAGGAIDPVAVYRASGYRVRVADARPARPRIGGGIV